MAPVHDAAARNDVEALRGLLDEEPKLLEAEVDPQDVRLRPLHEACIHGSLERHESCSIAGQGSTGGPALAARSSTWPATTVTRKWLASSLTAGGQGGLAPLLHVLARAGQHGVERLLRQRHR